MSVKLSQPTELHQRVRLELIDLLKKHTGELRADEMLALAAYLVGQVVAMQDQRSMTPEVGWEIIERNIKQGNDDAVAAIHLSATRGSA